MNKDELDQALEFLKKPEGEIEIVIYASLKNNDKNDDNIKKLDIKKEDLPQLINIFKTSIESTIIKQNDYVVLPLSSADERGKCFYEYDIELPKELKKLEFVIGNDKIKKFNFKDNKLAKKDNKLAKKDNKLAEIDTLIVVLADSNVEISLYKKLSPVEVVGQGGYMLWKANDKLERFKDNLLRISPKFQAMRVAESVIIIDLNSIEKSLGFYEVITREATASLNVISNMNIVKDIESLGELVSDISFARKLVKVAKSSPVIKNNIPNETIIQFSKSYPTTRNMKYSEDESQFDLSTRVSKDLFIKILNDDLLTSELTKRHYESLAKDGVEIEQDVIKENNPIQTTKPKD